eukprot:snap_masked-scaffold_14-processed-gene-11.41-mRNA-1 protein AED:0.43 eAED:0.43 QI:0/-1/0/1/-1/1/1/0/383
MTDDRALGAAFCYIRAFYFTITTLSSVGYGDIRPYSVLETAFELIVILTAACMFAAIIGIVAMWCYFEDNRGMTSFKTQLRQYKAYMKFRKIPEKVQVQIVKHLISIWEAERGLKLQEVHAEIPKPLQLELSYEIHQHVLQKVQGFRSCSTIVQKHIARWLRRQVCSSGDYVYKQGTFGHEIYFVLEGEVLIVKYINSSRGGQQKVEKGLSVVDRKQIHAAAGAHFGGETLYSSSGERKEDVFCITDLILYYIDKNDFERILEEFPEHKTVGIFGQLYETSRPTPFQSKSKLRHMSVTTGNTASLSQLDKLTAKILSKTRANRNRISRDSSSAFTVRGRLKKQTLESKTLEDPGKSFNFLNTRALLDKEVEMLKSSARASTPT